MVNLQVKSQIITLYTIQVVFRNGSNQLQINKNFQLQNFIVLDKFPAQIFIFISRASIRGNFPIRPHNFQIQMAPRPKLVYLREY